MPPPAEPVRSRIYVSHRAGSDDETAARLIEDLRRRFGAGAIVASSELADLSSEQRADAIERALASCHSLVVIVGAEWLRRDAAEPADRPDDAGGQVRLEVATGLADERVTTIPVLLEDARMPAAAELPDRLAALADGERCVLKTADWDRDVGRLCERLERASAVARMLGRARVALEALDLAAAVRLVESALALDPGSAGAKCAAELVRTAREAMRRAEEPLTRAGAEPPGAHGAPLADENVQFTVFRRSCVQPERWYPLLAFAHLAERRPDADSDEPDPAAEVQAQAAKILGDEAAEFRATTQDSSFAVMREGELRFVPRMDGVAFNPPERRFFWTESVHREDFRMRAERSMDGKVARGTLTVYAGNLVLADVPLAIKVDQTIAAAPQERDSARPYRRIFASYSHRDQPIVEEFEAFAAATGDRYLRDVISLRSGEVWDERLIGLIDQADVFQLFWSWNALASPMVRAEWQHALALNRPFFVRPVYWEDPLPEQAGLPPPQLLRLHFQRVYPRLPAGTPSPGAPPSIAPSPMPRAPSAKPAPRARTSRLRLVQYGALAAMCVIGVGLYVTMRPQLTESTSSAPSLSAPPPPDATVQPGQSTAPPSVQPSPRVSPSTPAATPVPAPPAPPPNLPDASKMAPLPGAAGVTARDREEIERVLRAYEDAWSRMDIEALTGVWAMPAQARREIANELGTSRAVDVHLRVLRVEPRGPDRADAVAEEVRAMTPRNGIAVRRTERRRVFHLARRQGRWIIARIEDLPA